MKMKSSLSKTTKTVFLLLIATALLSLMSYTTFSNIVWSHWYKTVTMCVTRAALDQTPEPEPEAPRCSYTRLSPENLEAGRRLLDSITWPDTAPLPRPFNLKQTTSGTRSSFFVVPRSGGWKEGAELVVIVQMRDDDGNPKPGGGDFLVARLYNRQLGAGVVGRVQDHLNGTFTVVFPLLWSGTANVEVVLVQTSEAISVLKRLTEQQPDRVSFAATFRVGDVTQTSICNVCLPSDRDRVCNFTDSVTGEQWYCHKPKSLNCSARLSHKFNGFEKNINKDEAMLFQKGINMKVPLKVEGTSSVDIRPQTEKTRSKVGPGPSGYYHSNRWHPQEGATVRQFNSSTDITSCLRGKRLHLFGDSTIRQYYGHITKVLPALKTMDKHSLPQSGPFLAVDHNNDLVVTYRCHGPPIRFGVPVSQMRYVANELDGLSGGPDTVVVIGVWSHFSTFPMEVYYQRLMTVKRAVRRLMDRAPETTVIVRTANMKELTLYESLTNSDWFSLQRDRILRGVFKDSPVVLLDAWDLGLAHHLPHSLHPQPEIIKHMMDIILSHTCPSRH